MSISVVILAFNSETTISRTLQAAFSVSDDVHVVDSFSTDRTPEMAMKCGARVVQRSFERYDDQRNWAIKSLSLKYDWQLHLDADEYLSPELIDELNSLRTALPSEVHGYMIPRKVRFLGRCLEYGGLYPTWHMRLFRTGQAQCENRPYDQHFILSGTAGRLKHPMIDDHRMTLSEWTSRHNRWSDAEAGEPAAAASGVTLRGRVSGDPMERRRAFRDLYFGSPPFLRAFLLFTYRYFLRLGFLDGIPGLIYIVLQTFWFRFLIDAKNYERTVRDVT